METRGIGAQKRFKCRGDPQNTTANGEGEGEGKGAPRTHRVLSRNGGGQHLHVYSSVRPQQSFTPKQAMKISPDVGVPTAYNSTSLHSNGDSHPGGASPPKQLQEEGWA